MNKYKHQLPQDLRLLLEAYENRKEFFETLACASAVTLLILMGCFI